MPDPRRITLLTDFGTADGYVASMKGVIAALAPAILMDDAAHDIPPGDVHAAAWALAGYWRLYPVGTIHVVVVDPGVGSTRRAVAADADGRFLVAPDNGVLTRALEDAQRVAVFAIQNEAFLGDVVSATFHGRDVFAPVAAHLARGYSLVELGPPIADPVRLEVPVAARGRDGVRGVVVHIDRFGNLVTNIPAEWVPAGAHIRIAAVELPLGRTYADVGVGEPVAVIGSRAVVEISVREGNAAVVLGVSRGAAVSVAG